jgi:hypothetical protein
LIGWLRLINKGARFAAQKCFEHQIKADNRANSLSEATSPMLIQYDKNVLDRSRTQWQFGDWEALTRLTQEKIGLHPDRRKLALLAASGHFQIGDMVNARLFIKLALDWGCDKKLVSQILIAGVHNTLGFVAALDEDQRRSFGHFESSVRVGSPNSDVPLITQARVNFQLSSIQLKLSKLQTGS